MQTQTVEIVGFTRADQPMMLRKMLSEAGLLGRVSLVLGVRVTTTSIIESGRLGDPQNSAPPIHELPTILSAIREAGFERAIVWVPPKQQRRHITPECARMVYLWGRQAGTSTYQVMAPSPLTSDVYEALSALEAVDRGIRVNLCPQEGDGLIFRRAIPRPTTGEISILHVRELLSRSLAAA